VLTRSPREPVEALTEFPFPIRPHMPRHARGLKLACRHDELSRLKVAPLAGIGARAAKSLTDRPAAISAEHVGAAGTLAPSRAVR
jgi:hypothetical protein